MSHPQCTFCGYSEDGHPSINCHPECQILDDIQAAASANKNWCERTGRPCLNGAWDGDDGWGIDCAHGGERSSCPHLV